MPSRRVRAPLSFDDVRRDLDVPGAFPGEVLEEAEAATADTSGHADLLDVPFLTVDPPGSMDLDQAFHLERRGDTMRFRYAIADVAAFVEPGGAVDAEAWRRGVTLYLPDARAPLHPPVLGEGKASLLPGVDRPAVVWTVDVDPDGIPASVAVERAVVRSRRRLTYAEAQALVGGDDQIDLLQELGGLRLARERERGGVSLDLPAQSVVEVDGRWALRYDARLAVEDWNEQLSLLTGMCAGRMMVDAGVGFLRTLPPPDGRVLDDLRRAARGLGVGWPDGATYAEAVREVDRGDPRGVAFLQQAARGLRGAGYAAFGPGAGDVPDDPAHAAVASAYAHVTAPLRRLADRHTNEVVLAICAGAEVPAWASEALPRLVEVMVGANRKAAAVERAVVDRVEALVLSQCVGEVLDGTLLTTGDRPTAMLDDPAVIAPVAAADGGEAGERLRLLVESADPEARRVVLRRA
jgi:exoribonuclease R